MQVFSGLLYFFIIHQVLKAFSKLTVLIPAIHSLLIYAILFKDILLLLTLFAQLENVSFYVSEKFGLLCIVYETIWPYYWSRFLLFLIVFVMYLDFANAYATLFLSIAFLSFFHPFYVSTSRVVTRICFDFPIVLKLILRVWMISIRFGRETWAVELLRSLNCLHFLPFAFLDWL